MITSDELRRAVADQRLVTILRSFNQKSEGLDSGGFEEVTSFGVQHQLETDNPDRLVAGDPNAVVEAVYKNLATFVCPMIKANPILGTKPKDSKELEGLLVTIILGLAQASSGIDFGALKVAAGTVALILAREIAYGLPDWCNRYAPMCGR